MASWRTPGPLCQDERPLLVRDGLLGRTWSAAPGPFQTNLEPVGPGEWGGVFAVADGVRQAREGGPQLGRRPTRRPARRQTGRRQEPPRQPTVQLIDIRLVGGATEVKRGSRAPADTKYSAAIKASSGDVIVEAVLQGAADVPAGLTWSGGKAVAGAPLRRKVSRDAWAKHELTVRLGRTKKTMVVYVIGAEPTGFQGDGGTSYKDNEKRRKAEPPGLEKLDPATGRHHDKCQIQFTVRPSELVADAKAKRFDTNDIQWDVSRDVLDRTWALSPDPQNTSPMWVLWIDEGKAWSGDDDADDEEDNNPWDGGHLYGNDAPGMDSIPSGFLGFVRKMRAREWVRVNIGGGAGRAGAACSDYQHWHVFRSLSQASGSWAKAADYGGNEIKAGDPGWGATPKHGQRGR